MNAEWIELKCHPTTRAEAVRRIAVRIGRTASELSITYRLEGDVGRLRMPAAGPARIGKELWRHTCFEAFVAIEGQSAYHEFNFAPSGEWTVYAFTGYRDGADVADESMHPDIVVRSRADGLELDAVIRLEGLSGLHGGALLRIGLSAVIEAGDGSISYWALHHPSNKPDFHNVDGFTLRLHSSRQS